MGAVAGIVERTVAGMGYELVDAQQSNRGRMLRVFIGISRGCIRDPAGLPMSFRCRGFSITMP